MSTLSGLVAGVAAGKSLALTSYIHNIPSPRFGHRLMRDPVTSSQTGYIVSQQAATENIIRLKTEKARIQREARDAPGGEFNLNRGEPGAGGLEALDDKYATVCCAHLFVLAPNGFEQQ